MHVDAWDEVFIRCTRQRVNALVIDPPTWDRWWPRATTTATAAGADLRLRGSLRHPRGQHLQLTVDRVRPRDKGLEFSVAGDVEGTGEWYHLDERDGVVVHYLLRGRLVQGDPRRWVAAHRAAVRAALTSLKRRLEGGRIPGAEPHPQLLAVQEQELRTFAEEVARHEREKAAAASAGGEEPAGTRVPREGA